MGDNNWGSNPGDLPSQPAIPASNTFIFGQDADVVVNQGTVFAFTRNPAAAQQRFAMTYNWKHSSDPSITDLVASNEQDDSAVFYFEARSAGVAEIHFAAVKSGVMAAPRNHAIIVNVIDA
eukprot:TRINITY_DN7261_c0_g1_i4.p1 TRINITY_DN7261_c0_g1~~TRINITY_DN7261_c0_g1_i4.p1  ORF type:complete len:121 (+),score=40.98 TRINITY_DN7261_c0_g1_i4:166-528(+)